MGSMTVQAVALLFGVIYLAAGVLGFLPLLGGSLLHNLVHVVIGIAGLAAVASVANSKRFSQIVGLLLLLLGVIGVFDANLLGLLYLGGLDIALHLVSGAVLVYFGFAAPISTRSG
jgi:hypothetical protein